MGELQRIQQSIREQNYRISSHANEEMSDDNLLAKDVESVIITGKISRKFTRDPRGTRYELIGDTTDGECMCSLPFSALGRVVDYHSIRSRKLKIWRT